MEGTNTIVGNDMTDSNSCSYGVFCEKDLNISGSGELRATGGLANQNFGLKASGLLIYSGLINATGVTASACSYGVEVGRFEINGGSINATGGMSTGASFGLGVGNLFIYGGSINAEGGTSSNYSYGINAASADSISGGIINSTGGSVSSGNSYGIKIDFETTVENDAIVNAKGGEAKAGSSFGLDVQGSAVIKDSAKVNAESGNSLGSYGIRISGAVIISGNSKVNGKGETNKGYGYGLCIEGSSTVIKDSAKVNVIGNGWGMSAEGSGFYIHSTIVILGGTIEALGSTKAGKTTPPSIYIDGLVSYGTSSSELIGDSIKATTNNKTALESFAVNNKYYKIEPSSAPPASGGGGGGGSQGPITEINSGDTTNDDNLDQLIAGKNTLTVNGDNGARMVFDPDALKGIRGQSSGDIRIDIIDVSTEHQDTHPGELVVSLKVTSGGKEIKNFTGLVTISLPYELKEGETGEYVTVWYLADDGSITEVPCVYDKTTGLATFQTDHFPLYAAGFDSQGNPFIDVKLKSWFYNAVSYDYIKNLMKGTSATTFSPEDMTSRAMVVTILWRMEKEPKALTSLSFSDVKEGKWYSEAVTWASENNIVTGDEGKFNPMGAVTREELASILYRYSTHKGYDTKTGRDLLKFMDKPSPWAVEGMDWSLANGLIKGTGKGILDPKGNATRAQAASIFQRFVENTKI